MPFGLQALILATEGFFSAGKDKTPVSVIIFSKGVHAGGVI